MRFRLPGIDSTGQGATRQISNVGIYHVALVSRLVRTLDIALQPAVALAVRLMTVPTDEPVFVLDELELRFNRAAFTVSIDARIAEAVESVVPPRRGRPRRGR